MNALPPVWLLQPIIGEVFDSIDYYKRRLQGYALAEGFNIIQIGGGTKKVLRARFIYSRYRKSIRNYRKLESHIKYNKEDIITIIY